jgi:hypothetical protein
VKYANTIYGVDTLVADPRLQMREAGTDPGHVADLREVVRRKEKLPRIRVVVVDGTRYVVDGFHTLRAYIEEGRKNVECSSADGTWADAATAAAGANNDKFHLALKRTQADKRRAVNRLAEELVAAGLSWTFGKVAAHVGVSADLAKAALAAAEAKRSNDGQLPKSGTDNGQNDAGKEPVPAARVGADGKKYPTKRHTAPKAQTPPSTKPDGPPEAWRSASLDEFLKADNAVSRAFRLGGVRNAGDLHDKLQAGVKFGLTGDQIKAAFKDLAAFIRLTHLRESGADVPPAPPEPEPAPAKPGKESGYSWRAWESAFGVAARWSDEVKRAYPDEVKKSDALKASINEYHKAIDAAAKAAAKVRKALDPSVRG